ncbi:MAG: asparagine synthase (glutamine-hydrolyzing) [Chitinophagales bacterium]
MCGIVGIVALTPKKEHLFDPISEAVQALEQRGPDLSGIYRHHNVALGHTRLSVIDTSDAASQPFTDASKRYTIVFNGEIFNFREVQKSLNLPASHYQSSGDTEVLLYAYIHWGVEMLQKLNGFFALAIYDNQEETLFIARDRMGIKPLLVYQDDEKLIFSSEMKALLAFPIPRQLDKVSLFNYLEFNYIPPPHAIFHRVRKLRPGDYLMIRLKEKKEKILQKTWYRIPFNAWLQKNPPSYEDAQKQLLQLLEDSVQLRMIADVPLGAFLSGGIDSSVIVALASQYTQKLNTFSIGFEDQPHFDETNYAELVAAKYKTNHTVFRLTNEELFANLQTVLDYIDEPFADSSALAVNILSMHTRKYATVALSGDGGDELLAGYNKHAAEHRARERGFISSLVKIGSPFWRLMPKGRHSKSSNLARQLDRFATGIKAGNKERYWQWAQWLSTEKALQYMAADFDHIEYENRKQEVLQFIAVKDGDFNEVLYTDMHLVLQGDMLHKVDSMSMCQSLEVRTPFLDPRLVEFAFSLPSSYKINAKMKKRILQDASRHLLPSELYNRPKQGFEVPLLQWFRTDMHQQTFKELFGREFIEHQGIFHFEAIDQLLKQIHSTNPEDSAITLWKLLVFQNWWKRYWLPH